MPKPPHPVTRAALIRELQHALRCMEDAAAAISEGGRMRFRLIRCAARIRTTIDRAIKEQP